MQERSGSWPRRAVAAVASVAVVSTLLLAGEASVADDSSDSHTAPLLPPPPILDERPNVVVVLTDDQRRESMASMPEVQRLLVDRGTRYPNAMVPTSLCCPSRATILTGLYAHTMRMFGNGDVGGTRLGGWPRFKRRGLEKRTMGVALRRAGYRTALMGKYLNYFNRAGVGYQPRGWDTFSSLLTRHGRYYNYLLNDGTWHGNGPEDYSTDVFAARAVDFIRSTPAEQPLFLYFAPYGPHSPYQPAPRHDGVLAGAVPDYTAPTLEQPLADLPRWMRKRRHFTKPEIDLMRWKQQESLLSVDEAVGDIHDALAETGRERNTLFIYLSDNGYFWGEHRIIGKDAPYKDATSIPMAVRWDGHVPAGAVDRRMVLNVDVARTVAAATGVRMDTDGLDMLGTKRRRGFVLEAMNGYNERPAYCGWRSRHRMFVQWATGEKELFDYRSDPDEEYNLANKRSWRDVRRAMKAKAIEHCRPEPPHFDW